MSLEEELIEEFGYWGEHPRHSVAEWQTEVENNDTRRGYWEWCATIVECEGINEEESK